MADVKDLINAKKQAETHLRNAKEKIEGLESKRQALELEIPLIEAEFEKAERIKELAFTNFALGQISDEELEASRKVCDVARDKKLKAKEIIEGIGRAKRELEGGIRGLQEKAISANQQFWQAVLEDLKSEIAGEAKETVKKVWCVASYHGLGSSYQDFLLNLFPQPPIEENEKLKLELEREFLGE